MPNPSGRYPFPSCRELKLHVCSLPGGMPGPPWHTAHLLTLCKPPFLPGSLPSVPEKPGGYHTAPAGMQPPHGGHCQTFQNLNGQTGHNTLQIWPFRPANIESLPLPARPYPRHRTAPAQRTRPAPLLPNTPVRANPSPQTFL